MRAAAGARRRTLATPVRAARLRRRGRADSSDPEFPEWGRARTSTLTLRGKVRLADLLTHLYVLVPVLDDDKHYWVGEAEVEKLLRHGEGWLGPSRARADRAALPEAQRRLSTRARERSTEDCPRRGRGRGARAGVRCATTPARSACWRRCEARRRRRVLDLGCGEGALRASSRPAIDASHRHGRFERALEDAPPTVSSSIACRLRKARAHRLLHGSLIYRDERLAGYDAAPSSR